VSEPTVRAPTDAELDAAARELGRALTECGWQMAAAESCTGGLVGHVITQVPKASDHFLGGIVSYSDEIKKDLLEVPADLLDSVGAVSSEVAAAMARGALARFDPAHVTVAVTGIAGPDGGSPDKPVGLTFIAGALRDGATTVERHVWPFDRDGNKRASALAALRLASRVVSEA
jgi:PncC family amidohydrolase